MRIIVKIGKLYRERAIENAIRTFALLAFNRFGLTVAIILIAKPAIELETN